MSNDSNLTEGEFDRLAKDLIGTIVPANHDAIIGAWADLIVQLRRRGWILTAKSFDDVVNGLLAQKQAAEAKAAREAAAVANVFDLTHRIPNSAADQALVRKIFPSNSNEHRFDLGDSRDTIPLPDEP
jgi:hypothetical protein